MKKKHLGLIIVSLLAFLTFFTHSVKADVDYDITDMRVIAKVNQDGSLTMQRQIDYDFDSDAHGVFYQQNLAKKQNISNIKVKVNNRLAAVSNSGKNNTYQLTKNKKSYRFKVYHNISEDDKVKVEYSYKISNAITNYRDVAELNFKIIGNGWDTDIDHAQAIVIFPSAVSNLKAWAHGPLNGQTQVLPKQGKIIMTADDVPGDVGIEVHTIFPTSVTSHNKNFINQNKKKIIEKQEAKLAIEANEKRKRKSYFSFGALLISIISGIFVIFKGLFSKNTGSKIKKWRELSHNYEIPDVSPVAAQILDQANKPDVKAFTAYLMQLAGQHKIKIEEYKTKRLKKTAYRINLIDNSILKDELLDFIFKQVGNGESFTTIDLKNYVSRKLGKHFEKWREKQYQDVENQGYLDEAIIQNKNHVRMLMIGGLVFSSVMWILALFMIDTFTFIYAIVGVFIIVLEFVAIFVYGRRINIYTQKGALKANQVRGFKKMLDDIGNFKMKDVGDLILWEDIMPYAVAFGLSKKVLRQLQVEFNAGELEATPFVYYGDFYSTGSNSFESSFARSFSSGISYGSSSVSGGSGGFSGGSSGGFGGGSGGGAF